MHSMLKKLKDERYIQYMIDINVQDKVEENTHFNVQEIFDGLNYNYRASNYFIAQGTGSNFRFFAVGFGKYGQDAKVYPNRRGKETLVL